MRGCAVSRRYVCYYDMFRIGNVYLDYLKLCVVCINGRTYVCCGECFVVSNECDEPTSCLVQAIVAHCCEVIYFGCFGFRGELGFLDGDDICMCNQFEDINIWWSIPEFDQHIVPILQMSILSQHLMMMMKSIICPYREHGCV